MSGAETLEALRVIDPDVRVILSSGYYSDAVRSAGEGGELAGFLQKPYELSELLAAVHAALSPPDQEPP